MTRTRGEFLEALRLAVADAKKAPNTDEQIIRMLNSADVVRAYATFRGAQLDRLNAILSSEAVSSDELPDVVGQEKVGAGD